MCDLACARRNQHNFTMLVRTFFYLLFAVCSVAARAGEIRLYTQPDFKGREITLRDVTPDLADLGFQDRAASLVVRSGRWEVCLDAEFRAPCTIYERGEYRTVKGLGDPVGSARELGTGRDPRSWHRPRGTRGRIELFAGPGLTGNSTLVLRDTGDFVQIGFNKRAQGIVVSTGAWLLCSEAYFRGACRSFQPGRYPDLGPALTGRVSSARLVSEDELLHPAPRVDPAVPLLLFAEEGLRGRSVAIRAETPDLVPLGFNDEPASMLIQSGTWEVCVHSQFRGQCRVFGPGEYRALDAPLYRAISSLRMLAPPGGPAHPTGDVELFSGPDFTGARLPLTGAARALADVDFQNRARSLIVHRGRWQFCAQADYGGQCVEYGPGRYGRLGSFNQSISSLRRMR